MKGSEWLVDFECWLFYLFRELTEEIEVEVKLIKEFFRIVVEIKNELDDILEKYNNWIIIRVIVWIRRFLDNCKLSKEI